MTKILKYSNKLFSRKLNKFINKDRQKSTNITEKVRKIILDVKNNGDKALAKYTKRFDENNIKDFKVSDAEMNDALKSCDNELARSLKIAAKRIGEFHKLQMPSDFNYKDKDEVYLGVKWNPLDSVGLYVPGGKASYPSSVLMTALPAKIAGVKNISMCVPAPKGILNSSVLLAAKISGVKNIYKIGGAQAIAALTFGTESISSVNKIFGPGNS